MHAQKNSHTVYRLHIRIPVTVTVLLYKYKKNRQDRVQDSASSMSISIKNGVQAFAIRKRSLTAACCDFVFAGRF